MLSITMKTHLEFQSAAFPACPGEDEEINPGIYGKRLAQFLASELPRRGFATSGIFAEDWGWSIGLENEDFPLWIGCANYGEDGFLCFIEPSKDHVTRWFRRISTSETVARLAAALEQIIRASGKAHDLRWWDDAESGRG